MTALAQRLKPAEAREGRIIARMAGACAAAAGYSLAECPHPPGRKRRAWTIGFARSCISRYRPDAADFGLTHVKPCAPGPRADWSAVESDFLSLTYARLGSRAVALVLGRKANAVRIKACRLHLTRGSW